VPPDPEDPVEPVRVDEPEPVPVPLATEPDWFDPEPVLLALWCWASCCWTVVRALAYADTAFWAPVRAVDQACSAGTQVAICSGVTS
jgi:hypothetical protein